MNEKLQILKETFMRLPCKNDIYCALFYGSVAKTLPFPSADLDLHIILKKREINCLAQIKEALNDPNINFDVSIHYFDEVERIKSSPELFQNGTQGCHFLYTLANAEVIIGINPYKALASKVSHSQVKASFLQKALEYQWKIRNSFFKNGEKNILMFKYFRRILLVIGIVIGEIKVEDFDLYYVKEDFVNVYIGTLAKALGLYNHPAVKILGQNQYTLEHVSSSYLDLLDFVNRIRIQDVR